MSNGDYVLRPEAGPVEPDLLNRSQREAFSAIVAALAEANRLAAKSVESDGDPGAVQVDRVSRLFFVSGQPGSGKTSLYLTLRAILDQKEQFSSLHKKYKAHPELSTGLSGLDRATRWLESIDLEVAVDEGENLLAAVLVRISVAISESFGASENCREALEQLEELANDIGIAWDGNLKARGGSLDPDSYSQEVMRGQRTRLGINERLRNALETLFKGQRKEQRFGLEQEQLFVLPIDDFYLKPAASLALLRLLRMISVPRLFFLIMGDIKTVEALFFEKALADWTAVAGYGIFASLEKRQQQEVLSRVREMKARYLRKLLPIGQRADIEWTEWHEARDFKPPTHTDSIEVPPLSTLLSDVRISWMNEAHIPDRNLLNYLVPPSIPEPDDDSLDEGKSKIIGRFRQAYSGLQILDATPRELFDLWMYLRRLNREGTSKTRTEFDGEQVKAPPYLRMIVELALSAIEEQDFLKEEDQETLRFVFPSSSRTDLLVQTDRLRLTQKFSPWKSNPSGEIWVRRHFDWELRIADAQTKPDPPEDVSSGLPPRLAAWIVLLHDLVWNWEREYLVENLVHSLHERIKAHRIPITPEMDRPGPSEPGWAWYKDKRKKQWVHFSFPKFDTFRQLDRFLAIWSSHSGLFGSDPKELKQGTLEKVKNLREEAERLARGSDEDFYKNVREKGEEGKARHSG